jgi:DNA ligase-1
VDNVGDVSETVALLLGPADHGEEMPLHRVVVDWILPMANAPSVAVKERLKEAWRLLDEHERFVFSKLVRGNFRVGVQRALVLRALSQAKGVELSLLTDRFIGPYKPSERRFRELLAPEQPGESRSRPMPFCLAHQLTLDLAALGDVSQWQGEYKWDGIRAQVIRSNDGVAIWSRGEESVLMQFPEIAQAAKLLPAGTILDGEILAWRFGPNGGGNGGGDGGGNGGGNGGRPLSFNVLQERLNRKNVQAGLFDAEGVVFAAFDLLMLSGNDVRQEALSRRRVLLEQLMSGVTDRTGGILRLPGVLRMSSWEDAKALRDQAKQQGAEGLMLKHIGSIYHAGRVAGGTSSSMPDDTGRGAGWWKWKVDPYSVDAVMVYAQQGSGKRAGLFTDYTFAVWDGEELTPFAKAYSGLTNEEIAEVDRFVRGNTLSRAGPVRMVKPELVFEIAFEGIRESTRHRSGVAVRFPRMARWRKDKTPREADTMVSLRELIRLQEV